MARDRFRLLSLILFGATLLGAVTTAYYFRNLPHRAINYDSPLANFEKSDFSEAIAGFSKIIELDPQDAIAYYNRGLAHFNIGKFDEAISDYSKAIQINPKFSEAYNNRGFVLVNMGEVEKAIADYTLAIQSDPNNGRAHNNRARAYATKEEIDNAIADYGEVIRISSSNDPAAYFDRGYLHLLKSDWDKAITDCNNVIRLCPTNAATYDIRGYAHLKKNDFAKAISDFKIATQFNPNDTNALNNIAWIRGTCSLDSVRNGKEAVEAATKVCELTGWKEWVYIGTLAAGLAEAGDFNQAVKYQKQLLQMEGVREKDLVVLQERLELYQHKKPYHE